MVEVTTIHTPPVLEDTAAIAYTRQRATLSLANMTIAVHITDTSAPDELVYVFADHASTGSAQALSSASILADESGAPIPNSAARYYPLRQAQGRLFGDWRTEPAADETSRWYTGHVHDNLSRNDLGLIYMNARFYLPGVGRFVSADMIVPDAASPQTFNRYSYVENRPLILVDPTGHIACDSSNLPGTDQAACSNSDYLYPTSSGAEKALEQAHSDSINTLILFQAEAVANDMIGYPSVILSNVHRYQTLSAGQYIPRTTDYLNTIRSFHAEGTIISVPKYGQLTTGLSWGLPVINGAIYAVDIQQEYSGGRITSSQRWGEHGANMLFVGATGASGAGITALASAAGSPAIAPAIGMIFLAFDLTLAQEMTNNLIEGQLLVDAFWNARESTINTYFFWADTQSVDQWLSQWLDN